MRLGFRPTELYDAPAIQRLGQDSRMSRFIYWDDPFPRDGGQQLALAAVRCRDAGKAFSFSIFVDRRLAGMASIDRIDHRACSGHLFYWLGPPHWNQGVGTWAVAKLVEWAQQSTRLQRPLSVLYANSLAENEPSLRILHKNGFRETSRFLGSGDHGGKFAGRSWVRLSRMLQSERATPPLSP